MKGLIWVIVATAVLAVVGNIGGGYLIGGALNERMEDLVADADAGAEDFSLQLKEYESGTLSSNAILRIELVGEYGRDYRRQVGEPLALEFPLEIDHGPLIGGLGRPSFGLARVQGEVRLSEETVAGIKEASGEEVEWNLPLDGSPADVEALFGFAGDVAGRIDFHDYAGAIVQADDEKLELELQGVAGEYRLTGGGESVESSFYGDLFSYGLAPNRASLRDFSFSFLMQAHDSGLWPGRLQLQVGNITGYLQQPGDAKQDGSTELSIKDFIFLYALDVDESSEPRTGSLTVDTRLGPSSLAQGGERVALEAGVLDISLSRLSLDALLAGQQLAEEMEAMEQSQIDREMQNIGVDVLSSGPRLQINEFSLRGESGKGQLNGHIELTEQHPGEFDPFALLADMRADFELLVDKGELFSAIETIDGEAAAEQFRKGVDEAVALGYVEDGGERITSRIEFVDGGLLINGESANALLETLLGASKQ